MRFKYSYLVFIVGIFAFSAVFFIFGKAGESDICREFLKGYGWETEKTAKESQEITIPEEFDEVYKGYNEMQTEAGLDLLPYCGKQGVRYTYVVKNYPFDAGEPVYANVICINGTPVAGDIMTVSLSGFMHSLVMPQ